MRSMIFFCVITVVVLVAIFLLLRSRKLKEKYAVLWALVGIACLVLVGFPHLLNRVASLLGIQVGSNLLFTLAILLLLGICLQLSLEVSSQEDKIRRLAEEAAILRAELESKHPTDATRLPSDTAVPPQAEPPTVGTDPEAPEAQL